MLLFARNFHTRRNLPKYLWGIFNISDTHCDVAYKIFNKMHALLAVSFSNYYYNGTSNSAHLCATTTSWAATSGENPCQNYSQTPIKKPINSSHLQSTAKRPLSIVPMSNFTFINGQVANLLQANERKNKKSFSSKKMYIFKKP